MVVVDPRVLWMPRTLVKGEEFIRDLIPWCSIFIEEGNPVQSEANGAVVVLVLVDALSGLIGIFMTMNCSAILLCPAGPGVPE